MFKTTKPRSTMDLTNNKKPRTPNQTPNQTQTEPRTPNPDPPRTLNIFKVHFRSGFFIVGQVREGSGFVLLFELHFGSGFRGAEHQKLRLLKSHVDFRARARARARARLSSAG
jgi:hypothetical protein